MAMATSPKRARARKPAIVQPTPAAVGRALAGGRLSTDTDRRPFGTFPRIIKPPVDHETGWRILNLDERTLEKLSPKELITYLVDLSSDLSRAHHDFLRLCNPGVETFAAYQPGTTTPHPAAQRAIDGFKKLLEGYYGSFDVPLGRLFSAIYLRGAFALELVLDAAGRAMVDLATPDPATVYFRSAVDPVRGSIWLPGQWQGGRFVLLDRPTFRILPVDPLPGSPYGRAHAWPSIFPTLTRLRMIHDVSRVVAQAGYPYTDVSIAIEAVRQSLAYDQKESVPALIEALEGQLAKIQEAFANRRPQDAYAHTDAETVKTEKGAVDTDVIGGVTNLLDFLAHEDVRAMKTMPILQGMSDNVSEGNSNRQWEILAATIKAAQHPVETEIASKLELGLRAMGLQATVVVRFAEIRSAEMLRDEQTRRLKIANDEREYWLGGIDFETLVYKLVKQPPPAGVTEPLIPPPGSPAVPSNAEPTGVVPEPGSNRAGWERAAFLAWQSWRAETGDVPSLTDVHAQIDLAEFTRDYLARHALDARARVAINGNGHREEQP